jgi:hypothetical protein
MGDAEDTTNAKFGDAQYKPTKNWIFVHFFTGQSHNTPLFNQPGFLSLKFEPRIRNYWVMSLLDDTNWGDENSPFHTGIMRIYSNVNKPLLFAVNHNENIQNFFPVNSHGR